MVIDRWGPQPEADTKIIFLYIEDKSFFDNHKNGERITIIFSTCISLNVCGMPPTP